MGVELAPAKALLDQTHPSLPTQRDQNSNTLGIIGGHNIVIAVLPEIETNSAATVATQLMNDFPSIRFGLLVGIGDGVPDLANEIDIRLGDIVVSKPTKTAGGVVQYDMGKETLNGFERDKDGWTALHWAASNGHEVVVRLLLEKGADIVAKDKDGRTALHWAASNGHEVVVRLLLEKGANIAAKDKNGRTALHWAASNGHEVVVRLLTPLTPNS